MSPDDIMINRYTGQTAKHADAIFPPPCPALTGMGSWAGQQGERTGPYWTLRFRNDTLIERRMSWAAAAPAAAVRGRER